MTQNLKALPTDKCSALVMAVPRSIAFELLNINGGPIDKSLWDSFDEMWCLYISDLATVYSVPSENGGWSHFISIEDSDWVHPIDSIEFITEIKPETEIVELSIIFDSVCGRCGQ